MTDLKHPELTEERIKLIEKFFMNSHDGIYIVDKNGKVLMASPSIIELLGASYSELIGLHVNSIMDTGVYKGSPALEAIRSRKTFTGYVKARNGTEIMSTSKPIFNENNELELVITNCRPISVIRSFFEQYSTQIPNVEKDADDSFIPKTKKEFVYHSPKMRSLMKDIDIIANTNCTVIIYGETGTGKSMLAKYIHDKSPRRKNKFVEINCSAIPENLIESELFGYEKGAFTGADPQGKLGLFEIAHEGTIFLDEIGEMPYHLQTKLLKVLDTNYVLRLGGTIYRKVNTRVIVATNRNLKSQVKKGKFREDLFYRLNVFPVTMPPLRERKEDIKFLCEKIVEELNNKYTMEKKLATDTIRHFETYDWPGNIRQLRNIIERIYVMSRGNKIYIESPDILYGDDDIYIENRPVPTNGSIFDAPVTEGSEMLPLKDYMDLIEKQYIQRAIDSCDGSVSDAAKKLGLHRTSLYKKLNKTDDKN